MTLLPVKTYPHICPNPTNRSLGSTSRWIHNVNGLTEYDSGWERFCVMKVFYLDFQIPPFQADNRKVLTMLFPSRLYEVVRQLVGRNSLRRSTTRRRRRSQVECLEPRRLLTASYVPAYVLETPLVGVSAPNNTFQFPTFGDVDHDGDLDLLIGRLGGLTYFQNIGNSTTPIYGVQANLSDPFAGVTAALQLQFGSNVLPNPTLADWDSDGDLDLALGLSSTILAFENAGNATTPNFVSLTNGANPFNDVLLYSALNLSIAFGDLDGDSDLDAVLSSGLDPITFVNSFKPNYLENQAGVFVPVSGVGNPFDQVYVGAYSSPELGDLDGDGDVDLAVSDFGGTLQFFENTGTTAVANFVRPLGFITFISQLDPAGQNYAPAFGDLDDDGDQDLLVAMTGSPNGPFQYFRAEGDLLNVPVNGAPNYLISMVEDTAFVFSSAGNLISVADANAGSNPLKITLEASHGRLTLATTSGLVFSIGDGIADAVLEFQGSLSNINAALDGLTFVPDHNFAGDAQITITTNDLGQPDGGEPLFDVDQISIRVKSVQEAVADLRQLINDLVSYGEFTASQGVALLKNLEVTGNHCADVRNLEKYLKTAKRVTHGKQFTPEFKAAFLKFGEDIMTGLLT